MITRYTLVFMLFACSAQSMFIPIDNYQHSQKPKHADWTEDQISTIAVPYSVIPQNSTDHFKTAAECCWTAIDAGTSEKILFLNLYPCNAIALYNKKRLIGFHQSIQSDNSTLVEIAKQNFTTDELAQDVNVFIHSNYMEKDFTALQEHLDNKSYAEICKSSSQENYMASIANDINQKLDIPKYRIMINLFKQNNPKKLAIENDYAIHSLLVGLDTTENIECHSLGIHNKKILKNPALHNALCNTYTYQLPKTPPSKVLNALSDLNDTNAIAEYMRFIDGFTLAPTTPFIHLDTLICGYPQCAQCSQKDKPLIKQKTNNTNDRYQ